MLIIQFLMLIFIYKCHKLTIFHFLMMLYRSSQGNLGSQHDICEPKKRLGDQLVIFTAILFMKYQSLRPSWSWSYYPNYHVTGDGNVALLNWPRLCVLSHNQAGSSSPSFVFVFVFVFCHTSNLVPHHFYLYHHHRMIIIIIIYEDQVTNGYEAYQMIVFGELVHWPPWADVLSRLSMSSSSFLIIINCHHHKCHHNWQHWQQ